MSDEEHHPNPAWRARRASIPNQRVRNERLIEAREKRGWSQADLAARAGVTVLQVSKLERLISRGRKAWERAARVAIALGVPFDLVMPDELEDLRSVQGGGPVRLVPPAVLARTESPQSLTYKAPGRELELRDEVERLLAFAPPNDREVLIAYYGVGGGPPMTIGQLAAVQNPPVTPSRIYQQVLKAIERIRRSAAEQSPSANRKGGGSTARSTWGTVDRAIRSRCPPYFMPRMRWRERDAWIGECLDVQVSIERRRPPAGGRSTYAWYVIAGVRRAHGSARTRALAESEAHDAIDAMRLGRSSPAGDDRGAATKSESTGTRRELLEVDPVGSDACRRTLESFDRLLSALFEKAKTQLADGEECPLVLLLRQVAEENGVDLKCHAERVRETQADLDDGDFLGLEGDVRTFAVTMCVFIAVIVEEVLAPVGTALSARAYMSRDGARIRALRPRPVEVRVGRTSFPV